MTHTFHGVFSLLLFLLAIVTALTSLWGHSPWLGLLYVATCSLASCGILFAYCGKCSARLDNCSHVFPGKLTRLLPQRKQGPYSLGDIGGTALFLGVIVLFPQYWLLDHAAALILFWILATAAVAEILVFVCRGCENKDCILCPEHVGAEPENILK